MAITISGAGITSAQLAADAIDGSKIARSNQVYRRSKL